MGALEYLEFGFDDLRDCRDIKVIVGAMVGDVPRGSFKTITIGETL
jgi:hypothetical protein